MIFSAALLCAALALSQSVTVRVGSAPKPDSAAAARAQQVEDSVASVREVRRAQRDSASAARRRARVIPVTSRHIATAFSDVRARATLERARAARISDDSALLGYDAKARERASVGMSLTRLGRERLLARYERVFRVQWRRDRGARVQLLAERTTAPVRGMDVDFSSVPAIPYFPGREPLWGGGLARSEVIDSDIVNPLASGAEAYYTYESGDSLSFRIGGETVISVRELRVRPRVPDWRVSVGSLWFDDATGRLVRAVYRMAEPMNIWEVAAEEDDEKCADEAPRVVCAMMDPMTANVSVVAVEYGLHEGRFWLPRLQTLEGAARVGIMRVPFKLEQSFSYDEVNGTTDFAPVVIMPADTATGDSALRAERRAARAAPCAPGGSRERTVSRFENTLAVSVTVPCDSLALARSPELPASPYDSGEEMFSSSELDELKERALGIAAQAGYMRSPVELRYGLAMTRYNRVEGLSTGIAARQSLGGGYTARAAARIGLADLEPNAEVALARGNGRTELGVGVYRRLAAANDWGDPLAFGNSVSALLLGRDEGFYYRAVGLELTRGPTDAARGVMSRLFVEHHSDAPTETAFSVARALSGRRFGGNIDPANGTVAGLALRHVGSRGLDPHGWRLLSDVRLEGAAGTFDYSRAAADVTVSHSLGSRVDGALTLGGGTSGGALPVQRWWFLGGAHTVRGQPIATRTGNSYWLARGEIGSSFVLARPVIFADFGWAGHRADFSAPGTPISGAGVGASLLDGLVRVDVAKGIRPTSGVRGYLYLEARF